MKGRPPVYIVSIIRILFNGRRCGMFVEAHMLQQSFALVGSNETDSPSRAPVRNNLEDFTGKNSEIWTFFGKRP